jgi:GNAT superfamily N-acetyltransferase
MQLFQATSEDQIQQARGLFEEYAAWLEISLCFQNFDKELANLPGHYAPPSGRLLLAKEADELAGCIALRQIEPGVSEIKRLFLRQKFRGKGLGRVLVEAIIEEARKIGYRRIRLDTLPDRMDKAVSLYRSIGFREIAPYYENPVEGATFMELTLDPSEAST